jgi:cell shape-determining protein MreC
MSEEIKTVQLKDNLSIMEQTKLEFLDSRAFAATIPKHVFDSIYAEYKDLEKENESLRKEIEKLKGKK